MLELLSSTFEQFIRLMTLPATQLGCISRVLATFIRAEPWHVFKEELADPLGLQDNFADGPDTASPQP